MARIDPDYATLLRTLVVVILLAILVGVTGKYRLIHEISAKGLLYLLLSGLATGASWLCYFRAIKLGDIARVAPLEKLSAVIAVMLGVMLLGESSAYTVFDSSSPKSSVAYSAAHAR